MSKKKQGGKSQEINGDNDWYLQVVDLQVALASKSKELARIYKVLSWICFVIAACVLLIADWGCSNEKSAGEDCDNKGEVICGTTCVDIGSSDTCGNEDAVLYCDGYEWMVSQKCAGDCSCIEKNGSAYCECPNYY